MRRGRKRWLAAGVVTVAAAGIWLGVWLPARGPAQRPALVGGQARVGAMLPAITAYLQSAAYRDRNGSYSPADYLTQRIKWLCDAAIAEIRSDGALWRVGMDVACGGYARRGSR